MINDCYADLTPKELNMNSRRCNLRIQVPNVFPSPKDLNVSVIAWQWRSTPSELGTRFISIRRLHLRLFIFKPFGLAYHRINGLFRQMHKTYFRTRQLFTFHFSLFTSMWVQNCRFLLQNEQKRHFLRNFDSVVRLGKQFEWFVGVKKHHYSPSCCLSESQGVRGLGFAFGSTPLLFDLSTVSEKIRILLPCYERR